MTMFRSITLVSDAPLEKVPYTTPMCGRYGFIPTSGFSGRYDLAEWPRFDLSPHYNIAGSNVRLSHTRSG